MEADTIVMLPDIPVMYVAGQKGRPIAEQAPSAFQQLEARLPSLKQRRFYGVGLGDEYRACVAIAPDDDPAAQPHPRWTIPGGTANGAASGGLFTAVTQRSPPQLAKPAWRCARASMDCSPKRASPTSPGVCWR